MTEKEKMNSRQLYIAETEELICERNRAKDLCHAYNALLPSDTSSR
ncbi:MAG: sugar O-acetyltransferase, partial [Lachnospiraceae bacterium]|nr:sugar O-acetyltransferase [Lachnospiraceae bacterium]